MKPLDVNEYLAATDSRAIGIVADTSRHTIVVTKAALPSAVATHWVHRKLAAKIASRARRNLPEPTKACCEAELQRAAAHYGTQLTPHLIAVSRASFAAKRLADYLDAVDRSGRLAEFNREYRRRRMAATMRGEGFMSYAKAMERLRAALIRRLIARDKPGELPSFFDEIFGSKFKLNCHA